MSKGISDEKKEENRQLYRSIYEEYNKGDTTLALLGQKYGFSDSVLIRSVEDIFRRGALELSALERLQADIQMETKGTGLGTAFLAAVKDVSPPPRAYPTDFVPNYTTLLTRELQRRRIEKARKKGWPFG